MLLNTHIQLVMNSFWTLFHDKIFPRHFSENSLTVNKIPCISMTCYKIPWHVQVFQTSGHPVYLLTYFNQCNDTAGCTTAGKNYWHNKC